MKKIFLLGIAFFTAMSTFAQDNTITVKTNGKALRQNKFSNNWFIQVQGGGSVTFSEDYKKADLGDILAPHAALSVGKHFAPTVGARLQVGGWQSKNYHAGMKDSYTMDYIQVNVDGMFNLSNIFVPYTHEKVFNMYALLGAGYVHGFSNSDMNMARTNSIVPRGGLMFDFRVSKLINLNLETTANLMNDNFNGRTGGRKYDGTLNVLAGITFKLGKSDYDVVDVIDRSEVNRLVNEIRSQQDLVNERNMALAEKDNEIKDLRIQLQAKPDVVVEKVELEEVVMNAVVVFKLGRTDLQDNQEINIYNAAKFFQDNPDMDIRITGYADRSTGSATTNQRISEQRAEAVKNILVNKYNINPARITTEGGGDRVQPFATDEWNRVAIFTAIPRKK